MMRRNFSITTRLTKYAHKAQKASLEKRNRNLKTNAIHEGENLFNIDITKRVKTAEETELEELHKFKPK